MDATQNMEKDLTSVVKQILKSCKVTSVDEINHSLLMKSNKDPLADFVEQLLKVTFGTVDLCKAAVGTIDQLKTERIEIQQTVIDLQKTQLQHVHETVKTSVKDSVKTEISTWSSIVQKNVDSAAKSVKSVHNAVRSAVEENVRNNNFIIYGAEEKEDKDGVCYDNPGNITSQLFNEIVAFPKPEVLTVTRIGSVKTDSETDTRRVRPIKVTLASPEAVKFVLSKAHKLKQNSYEHWSNIYLSPDRSKEERAAHKSLVAQLKQRIIADGSKYHYIRNGKINTIDKALSQAGTTSASS